MGKKNNKEDKLIKQAMKIAEFPDGKSTRKKKRKAEKAAKEKRVKNKVQKQVKKKTKGFLKKAWNTVEDIFD
ncbi:MAG: hypothetical protein HQL53_06715 [Magnetococcales bacterium]|nr:hypothetical protein [Magnetococcales bacterium]